MYQTASGRLLDDGEKEKKERNKAQRSSVREMAKKCL
jgi:ribosomal protein S20